MKGRERLVFLPGQKFGKWEVVRMEETPAYGQSKALCKCECGKLMSIIATHLNTGKRNSCGSCAKKEHGMTATPTWNSWASMRDRCNNPDSKLYFRYGARGITICKEWKTFEVFLADMGIRPRGKTIDRINGNLGYSKENCRWATPKEQTENRSNTLHIQYKGKEYGSMELAALLGIKYCTLWRRIKRGYPIDAPLSQNIAARLRREAT